VSSNQLSLIVAEHDALGAIDTRDSALPIDLVIGDRNIFKQQSKALVTLEQTPPLLRRFPGSTHTHAASTNLSNMGYDLHEKP
jgi:hypothetical protein